MDKSKNNETTQSRRRFVKRTAVSAALVSLPLKSVWANGITNSIVASGHGSDWANGAQINLLGPGQWRRRADSHVLSSTFSFIFDGPAVTRDGSPHNSNVTLGDILSVYATPRPDRTAEQKDLHGMGHYNSRMVAMYLNAYYGQNPDNAFGVVYPVATGRPFSNPEQFARQLYSQTASTYKESGQQLGALISEDHNYVL